MSKQAIVDLARQVASGALDPLAGCRAIVRHRSVLDAAERDDPDLLTIVGIESETDAFPQEEARASWSTDALAEQDRLLAEYLQRNGRCLIEACRSIAERFSR